MTTRTAATDADLVAALQASVSGDIIKLTVSRDYTVLVSNIDCRPLGVTVQNDTGIDARIKTSATTNQGFNDCFGINFSFLRFTSTKFWGGGNVHIADALLAANLYFQGNHKDSSVRRCFFRTGGFGITLDGRRAGSNLYVENFTVADNTFSQIGVDPIRIFGIKNSLIENNTLTDVSSWRYSGNQTSSRLHSDGMDITQADGLTIRGNTLDLIEWQGIILKNHGYDLGWPEHMMRNVVIDGNTFSRIGWANFPEIGATGGGVGIYLQDGETVTVKNNIDGGNIKRAGLNWFHQWPTAESIDPVYATYNPPPVNTVTYIKQMKVFYGNNGFVVTRNDPPGGGFAPSMKNGEPLLPLEDQALDKVQGPVVADGAATSLSVGAAQGWVAPGAGHVVLVAAGVAAAGALTMAGFTELARQGADTASRHVVVFAKVADGSETTITLNSSVNAGLGLAVYEFSGLTLTEDTANVGATNNAPITSTGTTSITTLSSKVLLFAAAMLGGISGGWAAWSDSFLGSAGDVRIGSAYRITSTSGPYSSLATWTTPRAVQLTLAALKPADTAGSTVSLFPAAVTAIAVAVTPVPGPVVVSLAPAVLSVGAVVVSPTQGQPEVALAPAALVAAAQPVTLGVGPVTVGLAPAALSVQAQELTPSVGGLVVVLVPVGLVVTALALLPRPPDKTPLRVIFGERSHHVTLRAPSSHLVLQEEP